MAGFNAPVFILGISGGTEEQAGFRSPLPFLPLWAGPEVAGQAGFISPLPFWSAGGYDVIVDEVVPGGGGSKGKATGNEFHARLLREDEEILAFIMAATRMLQ